jgi:hypothetical protein
MEAPRVEEFIEGRLSGRDERGLAVEGSQGALREAPFFSSFAAGASELGGGVP